jgi:hypothetical protein
MRWHRGALARLEWTRMSRLSRGQRVLVGAALLGAVVATAIGFKIDPDGFGSHTLAELSGIGFGTALATLFIERVAKRVESAEAEAARARLHDAVSCLLGFLLESTEGNPFHWSKHARYSRRLGERVDALRQIKDSLAGGTYRLRLLQEKCVIESAHEAVESVRALSAVAFQLSGAQGLLWLSVANSVSQLAKLYPFRSNESTNQDRLIVVGQDSFSLNFCELIDHMLEFEQCKTAPLAA